MKTIITCAVTGASESATKHGTVPVTPAEISNACIGAARAGAAIVHIHVRDPANGNPSMDISLYEEVVNEIRLSGTDVVINLTTGPGARMSPHDAHSGNWRGLVKPEDRVKHVLKLRPEICSLDMGTLNFGSGTLVNLPSDIVIMAKAIQDADVKPELEVFDTGHIVLAKQMISDGLITGKPFFQMVLGGNFTSPAIPEMVSCLRNLLPANALWAAFGIGRHSFPMVAQSFLLSGHVRVGLEDNLYLERSVLAESNAQLVEKAVRIVRELGGEVASPSEARAILGLRSKHAAIAMH
jgi:uncharacterized protein (DUF849 family)